MREGGRRLKADPGSPNAEGEIGRMAELQRGGQVKTRSVSYDKFAVEMRFGEGRCEVHACTGRTRGGDRSNGNGLLGRGGAHGHLIAHNEAVRASDLNLDIGRARAGVRRKRPAARLRADLRDHDRLDPMADAVDVQPDLVTKDRKSTRLNSS